MAGQKKLSFAASGENEARSLARTFWRFSVRHYARPGMAARLIRLQDRAGLDVNLLLFCLFAATRGEELRPAQIRRAAAAVRPAMREALGPLRAARRGLGRELAGMARASRLELRARVLRLELELERHCQAAICRAVPLPSGRFRGDAGDLALANLRRYAQGRVSPARLRPFTVGLGRPS